MQNHGLQGWNLPFRNRQLTDLKIKPERGHLSGLEGLTGGGMFRDGVEMGTRHSFFIRLNWLPW